MDCSSIFPRSMVELILKLLEKGGQFLYEVTQLGNKIVLNFRFSIDKTLFIPSEYQALKDFFNLVINKQAEQII